MLSVIVPVYNAEKYIEKCLDSIINQSYKDLEIILVDDGSKDNSFKICENYSRIDNRVKLFKINNSGAAYARNYGLRNSTGEFVTFVDSDDWLELSMYENMIEFMKINDLDISICGRKLYYSNNDIREQFKLNKIKFFTNESAIKSMFISKYFDSSPCDKIYKRSLILENNIKFPEGKIGEDHWFVYKAISLAKGIGHIGNSYYYYRKNNDNSVTSILSNKDIDVIEIKKSILEDLSYNKELSRYFDFYIFSSILGIKSKIEINKINNLTDKNANFINNEFDKFKNKILLDDLVPLKHKIVTLLIRLKLFKFVKKISNYTKNK